jgi:hypothetical protein
MQWYSVFLQVTLYITVCYKTNKFSPDFVNSITISYFTVRKIRIFRQFWRPFLVRCNWRFSLYALVEILELVKILLHSKCVEFLLYIRLLTCKHTVYTILLPNKFRWRHLFLWRNIVIHLLFRYDTCKGRLKKI